MTIARLSLWSLPAWLLVASASFAQPAVERLEAMIRQQVGSPEQAAKGPSNAAGTAYLGLVVDDQEDRGRGVRVLDVVKDSPAAKGGLKPQDLITGIAGQAVRSMDELAAVVAGLAPGRTVTVDVLRGGVAGEIKLTVGRRPEGPPAEARGVEEPADQRALLEQLLRRIEALERRVAALEEALGQRPQRPVPPAVPQ
ncbi:MAG TPA: PDZ domain-containing protein [Planctomycetes bacterium]|nr:PDZ domain-containing protein [Planctomycetota bacterium]